jgi:type I restriction enzyme M protein
MMVNLIVIGFSTLISFPTDSWIDDRKAKYFFVPKAEIVAEGYDLSVSKFKEDVFEEVSYETPKVILEKLKGLEKEIGKGLDELTGMLR